jgi:hypothetical protein
MLIFNNFCKSKNCSEYIEWDFGHDKCVSCYLIGQSYDIIKYPKNCLFLN